MSKGKAIKFPKPPGLDLSDPKTLSGAKAVATRKNNQFRKMVEEKLPLFADELNAQFVPFTPERVIEDRKIIREGWQEQSRKILDTQRNIIRKCRTEVRELVRDEKEFRFVMRMVVRLRGGGRDMRWYRVLDLVKRRRTKPMTETADLVLAWLGHETKPVTHFEIWEKRGDGLKPDEILNALIELMEFAYVDKIDIVELPARFRDLPDWKSKTAWTWQTLKQE